MALGDYIQGLQKQLEENDTSEFGGVTARSIILIKLEAAACQSAEVTPFIRNVVKSLKTYRKLHELNHPSEDYDCVHCNQTDEVLRMV